MEKNKELIIFIPSIEDGGVEKNLYIIANYLSKKFNRITLITYENSKKKLFNKNIKFIHPYFNFINFKNRYPKYFLCLITLIKVLIFNRNYLVFSFQANIFAIILTKILNVKIISRSNSSSAGWSQNFLKQLIFNYFFNKADKIIVNSLDFKREMDKKYKINTECIFNPFEFEKIQKLSKKKVVNIFKSQNLKLLAIGRLTEQKDFITLLKSIKNLKRNNVELIIIGKGREKQKLIEYVSENDLSKKVKFLGYKKNPFPYLRQADILIMTSKFEGSPNVLVEGLFLKKFVISTNCPTGPREILNKGKFGKLLKVGDHKNITKYLENFKFSRINKLKIKKGFISVKRFDYKNNCNKYLKLINKFIK